MPSGVGELDGGGELAVGLLLREEGHVVVAGDFEGARSGGGGGDVLVECAVDEAFLRSALEPDAGVDCAFDEGGGVVAGHGVDVAGEDGEGCVPGALPAGIGGGEARGGRGAAGAAGGG